MTIYDGQWLRLERADPARERTLGVLAGLGAAAFCAYLAVTLAHALPRPTLSLVFNGVLLPVPIVAWWAYTRAQPPLRTPVLLLAGAATCWLVGAVVWQGFYIANGDAVPPTPGVYDVFFLGARVLILAALVIAMRTVISFRIAALDACVLTAAGVALGAPFVRRGLEDGVSFASLFTLNRPLLSILTLMLVVSAALGSSVGLLRSVALLAVAEIPLMAGNLIYSYSAVQGTYVDDRWANLAWAAGAVLAILAASVIVLGVDRPIRLPAKPTIPNHPAGSTAVLLVSLGAVALTLGVASYGLVIGSRGIALVGVVAAVAIAVAMALRARTAIREVEEAYGNLDAALAGTEHARDDLARANEELRRANAQIQAMNIAYGGVLNLADERSDGKMRELIEDTAGDLIDFLEEHMKPRRHR